MNMRIGIFGNATKPGLLETVHHVLAFLAHEGAEVLVEHDVAVLLEEARIVNEALWKAADRDTIARSTDIIVTFGGDGTILSAAQATLPYGTPMLGVNLGKLGFLADLRTGDVIPALTHLMQGRYRIEERMTLTCDMDGSSHRLTALNDVVVGKMGTARVVTIDAWVSGYFLATLVADGIIISTPTGSTAYSLATGGPIIVPSSDVIAISLISPHTLTARPIIVPGDSVIELRVSAQEGGVMVMADGQMMPQEHTHVSVRVQRGDHPVRLVKDIGPDYFEMLRTKLSWAQDARMSRESR